MSTFDPLALIRKRLLAAPNLSAVSRDTGISYRQLLNLRDGASSNPRMLTLRRLLEHFDRLDGSRTHRR